MKTFETRDLATIIRENPGCVAIIDNDEWEIKKARPEDYDDWTIEEQDAFDASSQLASSLCRYRDTTDRGHVYGTDILIALASIVGIKIESV